MGGEAPSCDSSSSSTMAVYATCVSSPLLLLLGMPIWDGLRLLSWEIAASFNQPEDSVSVTEPSSRQAVPASWSPGVSWSLFCLYQGPVTCRGFSKAWDCLLRMAWPLAKIRHPAGDLSPGACQGLHVDYDTQQHRLCESLKPGPATDTLWARFPLVFLSLCLQVASYTGLLLHRSLRRFSRCYTSLFGVGGAGQNHFRLVDGTQACPWPLCDL